MMAMTVSSRASSVDLAGRCVDSGRVEIGAVRGSSLGLGLLRRGGLGLVGSASAWSWPPILVVIGAPAGLRRPATNVLQVLRPISGSRSLAAGRVSSSERQGA